MELQRNQVKKGWKRRWDAEATRRKKYGKAISEKRCRSWLELEG